VARYLRHYTPKIVETCSFWRSFNVPLLLGGKPSFARFLHRCRLYGHFPWRHHCQPGRLPRLTGKCVSCGRSYFGVVDEIDVSVFPRREPEERLRFSSASGLGTESHGCASLSWDASKRGYIVVEIRDGRAWKRKWQLLSWTFKVSKPFRIRNLSESSVYFSHLIG